MNQSNLRRYAKPAGFVAAGLLAGIVMAGTVTAIAAEDTTGSTGGTMSGSESSTGKPPCPDKQRGGATAERSTPTPPSPSTVPSGFQLA
jgi:hypothetical protein